MCVVILSVSEGSRLFAACNKIAIEAATPSSRWEVKKRRGGRAVSMDNDRLEHGIWHFRPGQVGR